MGDEVHPVAVGRHDRDLCGPVQPGERLVVEVGLGVDDGLPVVGSEPVVDAFDGVDDVRSVPSVGGESLPCSARLRTYVTSPRRSGRRSRGVPSPQSARGCPSSSQAVRRRARDGLTCPSGCRPVRYPGYWPHQWPALGPDPPDVDTQRVRDGARPVTVASNCPAVRVDGRRRERAVDAVQELLGVPAV